MSSSTNLQVHHLKVRSELGDDEPDNLIALSALCRSQDLTEPFPSLVFFAPREQISPRFLAQHSQRIELLVIKFRPPTHSWFADLSEPLGAMAPGIDLFAGTRNRPTSIYLTITRDLARVMTRVKAIMIMYLGFALPMRLLLFSSRPLKQERFAISVSEQAWTA